MDFTAQRIAFGETLVELIDENPRVVVMDGDLGNSTRIDIVANKRPEHFLQMGIAEQNMMGVAAGLAAVGFKPVVSTFAAFAAKRGLDQIRVVIAQPRLHVIINGAYSGILTGKTGRTHQSVQDLSIFRSMPNMTVVAPVDGMETRLALLALVRDNNGPAYIRTTRDPGVVLFDETYPFKLGKAVIMRQGGDIALIGTGVQTVRCLEAADQLAKLGILATVLHVPTIKPFDTESVVNAARYTGAVVTAEDHTIYGGLGSAVAEALGENLPTPMKRIGWKDVYGESAPNEALLEKYSLTPRHIAEAAINLLGKRK